MRRIMMLLTVALVMAAMLAVYALPASAFHNDATADCGSAGTFTIRATETPLGPLNERPEPGIVLLFEEGGVLTVFKLALNGEVLVDKNPTGTARNNVDEVTCTFTLGDIGVIEATGILTP
jgi:hypothetical protein